MWLGSETFPEHLFCARHCRDKDTGPSPQRK